MKRVPAMVATILLAVLLAAYVAMAPFAGPAPGSAARPALVVLDSLAAHLNALAGRGLAIVGLLAIGGLLALLLGRAGKADVPAPHRKGARRRESGQASREQDGDQAFFRPDPQPSTAPGRIAALRSRALAEEHPAPEPVTEDADDGLATEPTLEQAPWDEAPLPAAQPEPSAAAPDEDLAARLLARPVILARKARDRDRDWTGDSSWLGGLPRLGATDWPRDPTGLPMHFMAQIDLAELGAACSESPLPHTGSLAVFAWWHDFEEAGGAVLHIAQGQHDFTDPPADLPPATIEGGSPMPSMVGHRSRPVFPFWPVEMVPLELGPVSDRWRSRAELQDIVDRIDASLAEQIGQGGPHAPFKAWPQLSEDDPLAAPQFALWWYGVYHLADCLQDMMAQAESSLARMDEDAPVRPAIAAEREALAPMVDAIEQLVADRDPWERLNAEETALVQDILLEVHAAYPKLCEWCGAPAGIEDLATVTLRAMATGAPEAFAALPDIVLERIQAEHAVPPCRYHRLFGPHLAASAQSAPADEIVLVELGYDDLMEWRWIKDMAFTYTISPADLVAGNWSGVQVAFTPG